jgi:hypothetical protein
LGCSRLTFNKKETANKFTVISPPGFKIKGDISTRQYTIILFVAEVMATFLSLYENKIFNFLTN